MKTFRFASLAVMSATLILAQGQGRGNGQGQAPDAATMVERRVEMLSRRLDLTDAQKTQISAIYTKSAAEAKTVRDSAATTRTSLLDAVKKNNTVAIDSLSATLGNSMGQLTAIEMKAEAAVYALLTPDQQAKYNPGGFGGPGMMGGPGGPGRMGGPPRGARQ